MAENIFSKMVGKKVVVRSINAGVFFGTLESVTDDGCSCEISKARKLWYWEGAASLSQLALEGVSKPKECKFSVTVPEMVVLGVIEIIPASEQAIKSIESVPVWRV